ncbi:RCC1 domain-containing protein [Leucobacter sp. NPDC015123]|uniref:RCC1 domain-containing protein n=1 Tax=Leucobacter sp. NPDC015123 TaxID=3364129 RepID=UPI0036F472D1
MSRRTVKLWRTAGAVALVGITAIATGGVLLSAPTSAAYTDSATAVEDTYTAPATYLAVSSQFTATSAALSGGYVWIWGYKGYGMSGNGQENVSDESPKPVFGLSDVTKVVGASDLSETYGTFGALTESGEVYTWGSNKLGRLGIGSTTGSRDYRATPQKVEFPDNERVIDLGSMRATMAALTESGKVYTWGSGQYGQAGNGSTTESRGPHSPYLVMENAHSMHVGQRLTWVVTRDNEVYWWGRSYQGENGAATVVNNPTPELVTQMAPFAVGCEGPAIAVDDPADTCGIQTITSSRQAGALITAAGEVYTFGNRAEGQIGRPASNTAEAREIKQVELPAAVHQISAGNYHFTALDETGTVWGWGDNASWQASGNIRPNGQTGQGQTDATAPIRLPLRDIIAVGGSRDTSYATRADSVLIGWGSTSEGAISGSTERRATFTPLVLPGIRVTEVY